MKNSEFIGWIKDNLPKHALKLNSGATNDEISSAEKEMNFSFPEELRELYLAANGELNDDTEMPVFVEAFNFASIELMMIHWRLKNRIDSSDPWSSNSEEQKEIKDLWWSRKWIPFGLDISGGSLCIDLDPGPTGLKGQIIDVSKFGPERVVAKSLIKFLEEQVMDIESGVIHWEEDGKYFSRESYS